MISALTRSIRALCAAMVLAVPTALAAQTDPAESRAFHDEFDTLDRSRWFVSDGWTNGPHQNCTWRADRVSVQDGQLRLVLAAPRGGGLDCAEIQTRQRMGFGTYEARMKVPYAPGMNANMFTFIGAPQNLAHNEIDFEFIARDGPMLQTNVHFQGDSDNEVLTPMVADGAFRTYSLTWTPDSIRWYIDGSLIREQIGGPVPDLAQKMYLSLWSTDTLVSWLGRFDPSSAPQVLVVDWAAFTPAGLGCRFEGSVLCVDGVSQ